MPRPIAPIPPPPGATIAPPVGPWLATASGRAFSLLAPRRGMIDARQDLAPALARTGRFGGHVPGGVYSVAQHCVLGADALFRETGRADLALWFVLHDAHEAYIGDITTPVAQALAAHADEMWPAQGGVGGGMVIEAALAALKARLDAAIHDALGAPWPPGPEDRAALRRMDLRMLRTERDQLMVRPPHAWAEAIEAAPPVPLRGRLSLWPWPAAADEWLDRLARYAPAKGRPAGKTSAQPATRADHPAQKAAS